jgi:L-lactate dehydrogenase
VFLQIIDPRAFSGLDAFTRQTGHVADACRASRPARAGSPVRTPGEQGLALSARQMQAGVKLHASIMPALAPWAATLGVTQPAAIG